VDTLIGASKSENPPEIENSVGIEA